MHAVGWEFSVCLSATGEEQVQATGILLNSTVSMVGGMAGKMADVRKAYEQTKEGLWRFDSEQPVSVSEDPSKIIAYWRSHSRLAECNDNMARMYGYEKADSENHLKNSNNTPKDKIMKTVMTAIPKTGSPISHSHTPY